MTLLWTGIALFILGTALIVVGRQMDAAARPRTRDLGAETLKPFFDWFLDVLKKQWPILTGDRASMGKRLAAAGSLLVALAILMMLGGIVVAVTSSAADAVT